MTGPRCRRKLSPPLLAACALWAGLAADAFAQGSAASDRAVLEALYDATAGPDWIDNTNWKTAAPLGEWFGVTTATAGRVTRLELPGNGLAGPIPAALGELALLRNLNFGSRWDSAARESVENTLTGPIPAELGNLANLEWLSLQNNALTGPVPSWLGRLTSLRLLYLGSNDLTGPIPAELGNLANLEWLSLQNNALTGPVPSWLGRLTSLRSLYLGWNALTGPIPAELGNLANLEWLSLQNNALTGPVPSWLGRLTSLRSLYLGWNALTGPIPAELGDLANLEQLSLESNALTGSVPSWLGRLTSLRSLYLRLNALTGPIPAELGDLANLEQLSLGSNALTGSVPSWLGRLTSLRSLHLSLNALTGPIPAELGDLANLEWLDLGSNALTGPIPAELGRLTSLRSLDLGSNALTGPIPAELGNLVNLERLFLGGNSLTGPVPSWLGRLTSLRTLFLSGNDLTGPLPAELGDLANLEWLDLGSNALTGRLPQDLTRLSQLRTLDISNTGACAPANAEFQAWLETIAVFRGDTCNRSPESVGTIPPQALAESGPAVGVAMDAYFTDPDDDSLTYTAASGQAGTVTAVASVNTVWLVPRAAGMATVTVTATDPGGLSATQSIAVTVNASAGPQNDREVLEVLYDSTGGENWTNRRNWKTSTPLGDWYGVATDTAGRVTELDLGGNELTGLIPGALGDLELLQTLHLGGRIDPTSGQWLTTNALTGPIPDELGRLENLSSLRLGWNELTGRIPDALGNLTRLESLSLNWNELTGPIPAVLGRLSNLRSLWLRRNELTGRIPDALGNLTNLESLDLGRNRLTGPIPSWLGRLSNLRSLHLRGNELTGRIPDALGNLANLEWLYLGHNGLTGPIPAGLGTLSNLRRLDFLYSWGLTGPLPAGLESSSLEELGIFATQICAPTAWRDWLDTIEFDGRLCEVEPEVAIDVAVFHTRAAREAAGGAAAIAAVVDLMVAETNQAYAASGVDYRLRLVERSEVAYDETGSSGVDLNRIRNPSDGHMDAVHAVRDRVGADLVHLIVSESDFGGRAYSPGAFALTDYDGGGYTFAHELGHNMGLRHDRYEQSFVRPWGGGRLTPDPAYGYVNQQTLVPGTARSRRWRTIMAYGTQCSVAYTGCSWLLRFSNPRQSYTGDPLGVPFGSGGSGVTGAADAAAVLNATGPAVALWRDHVLRPNRPPEAVGTLPNRRLTGLSSTLEVDVSQAFVDPDGDLLSYGVSSSAPRVVAAQAAAARVTLAAVGEGTAAIRVTATDPGGLSATQAFTVTVTAMRAPFTDDPIVPGVTPIKAVHFTELRTRIDALRSTGGLARFSWTDPVLRPGVTRVRRVHLLELRQALAEAYSAAGRAAPRWTDTSPAAGTTPIRALHVTELRAAVLALE